MRSIVLPWYPGGHVLSKIQDWHVYLQDRHGEGSQKKKHKAKNHEDHNPIKECGKKTGAEGELQELKKPSPAHPCHRPLPYSKTENASPHNLRVLDKTHKKGTNISISKTEKRVITKGQKIGPRTK